MTNTHPAEPKPKPKIWMVCNRFGQSSEVWMYRHVLNWADVDLTVMCARHVNEDQYPMPRGRIETVGGRTRLPSHRLSRDATQHILGIVNRRVPGLAKTRAETRWWCQRILQTKPDLIACQFGTVGIEMAPLCQHFDIPLVMHFHGSDLSASLRERRYRNRLARYGRQSDAMIVCAQYMQTRLTSLGVPRERVHVIPYGIELGESPTQTTEEYAGCRFLAVGRLVNKKRPDLLLRSFESTLRSAPDATLTMIGDGPMMTTCKEFAQQRGIDRSIRWLGAVSAQVVDREMWNADCFVQHSMQADNGDCEGWPVAIAEAAAHRLPVVSTRHAEIPKQIVDGVGGLLCDEGDWQTMANHMITLATNLPRRREMGLAARQHIGQFDIRNQADQIHRVWIAAANYAARRNDDNHGCKAA